MVAHHVPPTTYLLPYDHFSFSDLATDLGMGTNGSNIRISSGHVASCKRCWERESLSLVLLSWEGVSLDDAGSHHSCTWKEPGCRMRADRGKQR